MLSHPWPAEVYTRARHVVIGASGGAGGGIGGDGSAGGDGGTSIMSMEIVTQTSAPPCTMAERDVPPTTRPVSGELQSF